MDRPGDTHFHRLEVENMSHRRVVFQLAAIAILAIGSVACSGADDPGHDVAEAVEAVEEMHGEATEAVSETLLAAKLAGADLADGTEDHIVGRCPGCSLMMEGSADHALTVEDYELHFCSDSCLGRFEKDAVAKIAQLEIPEP
jgi:hypothetical protein